MHSTQAPFALAIGLALFLATSACSPRQAAQPAAICRRGAASAVGEIRDVAQEAPGRARHFWTAANEQARAFGGNLTATEEVGDTLVLAFANGVTLRGRRVGECDAGAAAGARPLADYLGAPETVVAQIYKIGDERVSGSAQLGGLCGDVPTDTLAAVEFVGEDDQWALRLASFQGVLSPEGDASQLRICLSLDYTP